MAFRFSGPEVREDGFHLIGFLKVETVWKPHALGGRVA